MTRKLYSYVVDHDHGLSPNPSSGYCTLVHCKFSRNGMRKNIVELAGIGSWVLGTGGQSSDSAGNGHIIYLMRVDEKLPFKDFLNDPRFSSRADQSDYGTNNTFALISKHFFYFGRNALLISELPDELRKIPLEKRGPAYRTDYTLSQLQLLTSWFEKTFELGVHGEPCAPIAGQSLSTPIVNATCNSSRCKPLRCE